MIVDAEPLNSKVTQSYLQDAGYQRFSNTSDETQAVALIERYKPDLVLLDIVMPKSLD